MEIKEVIESALQFMVPKGADALAVTPSEKDVHESLLKIVADMNAEPELTAHAAVAHLIKFEKKEQFTPAMIGFLTGLAVTNLVLREPARTRELLRLFEQGARELASMRAVAERAERGTGPVGVPGNETIH